MFKIANTMNNPIRLISILVSASIIYSSILMIKSNIFLLDGRGNQLELNLLLHLSLVFISILFLIVHGKTCNTYIRCLSYDKTKKSRISLYVFILVFANYVLWIFFGYGEYNDTVITGAYFISLFNLQYVMPIYTAVAPKKKWAIALILLGVGLTLLRGSTAVLFLTLIVVFSRFWIKTRLTPLKLITFVLLFSAIAFVSNEIKIATRGILTDLDFIDYGIARINQFSNLLYLVQNIGEFKVHEKNFIPQIVYESLSYIIPNSILGYDPKLDYEFQYTEIVTNYSGIVSYSTTTWLGKLYLYIRLGLFGSAAIFFIIPLLCGYLLRRLIRRLSEYRLIPVLYSMEFMLFLSGNFSFYTKYCFILFFFIFISNFKILLGFCKNKVKQTA